MKRDFFYVVGAFILLGVGLFIGAIISRTITGNSFHEEVLSSKSPISPTPTLKVIGTPIPIATPTITNIPETPTQFPNSSQ